MENHSNQNLEFCDDCTPAQVSAEPRDYRALTYSEFKTGYSREECYERLFWHFGEHGPSRESVYVWYGEFRRERRPQPQGPCLNSELMEATSAIHREIEKNRRVDQATLCSALALSRSGLQRLLVAELGLARRHSRWVPMVLKEEQRRARLDWCRRLQETLTRGERCVAVDEYLLARSPEHEPRVRTISVVAFFNQAGHMLTAVVQRSYPSSDAKSDCDDKFKIYMRCRTNPGHLGSTSYSIRSLPDGAGSRARLRGKRRLLLRYARCPGGVRTLVLRQNSEEVDLVRDPANSPDLLPADFAIYPRVGETLARRSFKGREETALAYDAAVRAISSVDWKHIFEDWLFRIKECIAAEGRYFEEA